jgi:acyl carrier protein
MLQDTVLKEIATYVNCQPGDISLDMRLDDIGVDSLGAITILFELEDKLNVDIPTESLDSLKIVGDVVDQLDQLLEKKIPA